MKRAVLWALFACTGCRTPPHSAVEIGEVVLADQSRRRYEVYRDGARFLDRLRTLAPRGVDFDDIPVPDATAVAFDADRYLMRGIMVHGDHGQRVHPTFGRPDEIRPSSSPNAYAPGGNRTTLTFHSENRIALTAAVGATFLDADPNNWAWGHSSLQAFYLEDVPLVTVKVEGRNGTRSFAGIVFFGADGLPAPTIANVVLLNGEGWPGAGDTRRVDGNTVSGWETAAIDDLVFAPPIPALLAP